MKFEALQVPFLQCIIITCNVLIRRLKLKIKSTFRTIRYCKSIRLYQMSPTYQSFSKIFLGKSSWIAEGERKYCWILLLWWRYCRLVEYTHIVRNTRWGWCWILPLCLDAISINNFIQSYELTTHKNDVILGTLYRVPSRERVLIFSQLSVHFVG